MEDARRYLSDMVDPTIADLLAEPRSARRALLACIVLFHVVDYLAHPGSSRTKREEFGSASDDFLLIDRIAHAAKHVISGDMRDPLKKPLDSRKIVGRPPAFYGVGRYGVSRYNDTVGGVTLVEDPSVDVLSAIKRARAFINGQVAE